MSDHFLSLIPEDPYFVPVEGTHAAARWLFEHALPDADEVELEVSDFPQVIVHGPVEIWCPRCGTEDQGDWWGNAVDAAFEDEFEDLRVRVPCCGQVLSLNELDYRGSCGFARFELVARNPGRPDIDAESKAAIERVLGTPLRRLRMRL